MDTPGTDLQHYSDIIMNAMVSQVTGVSVVCSTICSGVDQRKHVYKCSDLNPQPPRSGFRGGVLGPIQ